MLYCMTLYYTILYYTILYYTILYYTILYYTILYYTILYYTILYYTILYYTNSTSLMPSSIIFCKSYDTLGTTQALRAFSPSFGTAVLAPRCEGVSPSMSRTSAWFLLGFRSRSYESPICTHTYMDMLYIYVHVYIWNSSCGLVRLEVWTLKFATLVWLKS